MAFGNYYIVLFWFLFSHGKNIFVCLRSFYLLLNEKCFLYSTSASRCWLYVNCLVNTTLWICWHHAREIFQGKIFLVMLLLSSQDFTGHQEFFFYMWEIPLTLVFTCLYLSLAIYLSLCDRKFVFSLLSTGCVIAYVNVARKRELSQKPNLCCGGHYLYVNKSLQKICCLFFKALSIMKVFSLTIHNST